MICPSIYPGSTLGVSYLLKYLFIYLSTSTRPSIYSGSTPLGGIYLPICLSVFLSICLYTCVYLEVVRWTSVYAYTCLFVGGGLLWLIYLSTSLYIIQLVLWCSMYIPIYQSTYTHLPWGCYERSVSSYPSI